MIYGKKKLLKQIKSHLYRIPVIGKSLRVFYRKIVPNKNTPEYWINRYLSGIQATVVQIGSNDGVSNDPIHDLILKNNKWNAILVEPVPYLFQNLTQNYPKSTRIAFENSAINDGSSQDFYFVNEEASTHLNDLPPWYNQLGSFDKTHILKHMNGVLEPFIEKTRIKGLTLRDLFKKYQIESVDLLHIDTEGYDWNILSQLDIEKYKPLIILYEFKHLGKEKRQLSREFLQDTYLIKKIHGDFLCIDKNRIRKEDSEIFQDV